MWSSARLGAVVTCAWLAGCDQFARIGVEQASFVDSGPPPEKSPTHVPDAMITPDAMTALDASVSEPDAAMDAGFDAGACPPVSMEGPCNPVTPTSSSPERCADRFSARAAASTSRRS